ncbi:aldehyde dehydrogenase family protein [Martelella alba]|uniref:aldehyde dehydrogenase family protein n=1 Tax=Martelella alba TaxID=2590451 RepID=UPI0027D29DFF|nr:aldehyde dehydrogenase family protein [Martelella alba]
MFHPDPAGRREFDGCPIRYRHPLIPRTHRGFCRYRPFNFPAMIPMGWMAPMCIASGNTMMIKAASMTPMTCMEIAKLYQQAGVPDGVINIVTCSRNEADMLLTHPDINGVSFVGSTSVGLHVYSKAAAHGKRVQALCEAKNHALVLADAPIAIKRVKNFEEGLQLMNRNPLANGSVIFTQNGHYAREFQKRTHGGMVGINVGIPVPVGVFPFSGHKHSFFGDLHCLGKDGMRFYTETKCVTSRWFDEEERKREKVDSWDGTL